MGGDAIFPIAFCAAWAIVAWTLGVSGLRAVSPESYLDEGPQRPAPHDTVIARSLLVRVRDALAADPQLGLVAALNASIGNTRQHQSAEELATELLAHECFAPLIRAGAPRPWELRARARLHMFDRRCRPGTRPVLIATAACVAAEGADRCTIDTHRALVLGAAPQSEA